MLLTCAFKGVDFSATYLAGLIPNYFFGAEG